MDLSGAYRIINTIWYVVVIIVTVSFCLKYNTYLKKVPGKSKESPKELSAAELSFLLYGYVGKEAFVAAIIRLIEKRVILIKYYQGEYYLNFDEKKIKHQGGSDLHLANFLFEMQDNLTLNNLKKNHYNKWKQTQY